MSTEVLEYLSFFFGFLAFLGAVCNSNLSIWGFYIWTASNTFSALFDWHFEHWGYLCMHLAFLVTNFNGIYKYKKKQRVEKAANVGVDKSVWIA